MRKAKVQHSQDVMAHIAAIASETVRLCRCAAPGGDLVAGRMLGHAQQRRAAKITHRQDIKAHTAATVLKPVCHEPMQPLLGL